MTHRASELELLEHPHALTLAECDDIIERFGPHVTRSKTTSAYAHGRYGHSRTRTSSSVKIGELAPASLRALVAEITKLPVSHQERWEVIRYLPGQEFQTHHDWFPRPEGEGGERLYSVLVYLRAPLAGGSTDFPRAHRRITPEAGKLVLWNNTASGRKLPAAQHAARPVLEGVKWSLVTWVCAYPAPPLTRQPALG